MSDFYRRRGKRLFDIASGILLLLASLPVQIAVATAVAILNGRPVLFAQERPGLSGERFRLRKFRSMREEHFPGEPDADRLTPFGCLLRSTSLDELPELWSVIRGDMSLVGPRPLLMRYLPLYTAEQARRHTVRPGITGLAQVSGRNSLSWEEKFTLDVSYVDSISFVGDLCILGQTLIQVLKRSGISEAGQATMAPFAGRRGSP